MKDACERAYLAAVEALDVFLAYRGYGINKLRLQAHLQRSQALSEILEIDPSIRPLRDAYSMFITELHGMGFYSNGDPKIYLREIHQVKPFIDMIEELITI